MSTTAAVPDGGFEPPRLTPEAAIDRYLNHRRPNSRQSSIDSWYYDLKRFNEYCQDRGIDYVDELTGWHIDEYETQRRGNDVSVVTLNSEIQTIKTWLEYLARIEVIDDGLPEKVDIPQIPEGQESRDEQLPSNRAHNLIKAHRRTEELRGTRQHVILEILWWTACRLGALRALDLDDYHSDEEYLRLRNRIETQTPLKQGAKGERAVGLPESVCTVIDEYIEDHRYDVRDEAGRRPLITTKFGRVSTNTVRTDTYLATQPCLHQDCPHGRERVTCSYTRSHQASKCPSSEAPHHLRTGSISWHRDCGIPAEVVAARVNASLETIEKYYDKSSERDKLERRRRPFLDALDFDLEDDQ